MSQANGVKKSISELWAQGVPWAPDISRENFPLWPHATDVEAYEKLLRTAPHHEEVIILGATPALRDLTAHYTKKVTVADVSSLMMVTTSSYLQYADPNKERWIRGDWLTLNHLGLCDLVVGDFIWWMFNQKEQGRLLQNILSWLRPEGSFLSRFYLRLPRDTDIIHTLTTYLNEIDYTSEQAHELYHMALLQVTDLLTSPGTALMDRKKASEFILSVSEQFPKHTSYLKKKARRWANGPNLYLETRESILNQFNNSFELIGEEYAATHSGRASLPIMLWSKKS